MFGSQESKEFEGALEPVTTQGEDSDGYIMHRQYPEKIPVLPDDMHAFVGFARVRKDHPDVDADRDHLIPLGRTYAQDYAVACSVILSHPPVQKRLAAHAVNFMVVRSDLDMTLRLLVKVPAWAVSHGGR